MQVTIMINIKDGKIHVEPIKVDYQPTPKPESKHVESIQCESQPVPQSQYVEPGPKTEVGTLITDEMVYNVAELLRVTPFQVRMRMVELNVTTIEEALELDDLPTSVAIYLSAELASKEPDAKKLFLKSEPDPLDISITEEMVAILNEFPGYEKVTLHILHAFGIVTLRDAMESNKISNEVKSLITSHYL